VLQAVGEVVTHDGACSPFYFGHAASVRHGPPAAALLSTVGALRRPVTRADAPPLPLRDFLDLTPARAVYVDYIRRARVVAGVAFYLVPAFDTRVVHPLTRRCRREYRRRLARAVAGMPAAVRRRARTRLDDLLRQWQRSAKVPADDGVLVVEWPSAGSDFGGFESGEGSDAAAIERGASGLTLASGGGPRDLLSEVVPDGIASVTFELRGRRHGRGYVARASVDGNVAVAKVPRRAPLAQVTIVWRAADGRTIRIVRRPFLAGR
jgi:hypothetical protein